MAAGIIWLFNPKQAPVVSPRQTVVVVDLKTKSIISSIVANGVHGMHWPPILYRGFISNGAGDGDVF